MAMRVPEMGAKPPAATSNASGGEADAYSDPQRRLLAKFSDGHQVLYLVAQLLHGVKQRGGSGFLIVSQRHKDELVALADRSIREGLLEQAFANQVGSKVGLCDSLELTDAGRERLGLPKLTKNVGTKEMSLF